MKKYICPINKVIEVTQAELICNSRVDETGIGTGYGPGPSKARGYRNWDDEDEEEW